MSELKKIINAKIVMPDKILEGELLINRDKIDIIADTIKTDQDCEIIDVQGKFVLPGFIDIHTNGSAGFDCTNGYYDIERNEFDFDRESYLSGVEKALKCYLENGCTRVILSTIAAPPEQVRQAINYVKEYKDSRRYLSDVLFGIMIEGSFIKETANGGAHNPEYFSAPGKDILKKFIDSNEYIIKIVNIPPEWGEVSYDAYKILKEKSIISAVGHTAANADEVGRAISLGMKLGIHLFNGPSFSSYKPFNSGGTVEALLKSDEVFVEIITDGFHVDKSYFMDAVKRKGIDKIIAITDNMFVTGHEIKDEFIMGNKTGVVSNDKKYLYIKDNPVALFGSNLNMKDAFENVLNWFTSDIEGVWNKLHEADTFENALLNSSKLFSANPAKLLNISHETGLLEKEKKADIIIADIQYNKKYSIQIDKIIVKGNILDPD